MASSFLTIRKIIVFLLLPFWVVQADVDTDCQISQFSIFFDNPGTQIFNVLLDFITLAPASGTFTDAIDNAHQYFYLVTPAVAGAQADFTLTIAPAFQSQGSYPPSTELPIPGSVINPDPTAVVVNINVNRVISLPRNSMRTCSYNYEITLHPAGSVNGDPQFKGLRGQSYQVHGIDGAVYNLISTNDYAVNSRFEFLTGPRYCPIMPSTGRKSLACWSHDGSYLANIAIVTSKGEKFAAMSGPGTKGFAQVVFNDRELNVGSEVEFSKGSIFYNSTHELTIHIGVFHIDVENIDGFVNLRRVHVDLSRWMELTKHNGTHGLLGQTWQDKVYKGQKIPEIEGDVDDYVINNNDIYGTDFVFNRLVSE